METSMVRRPNVLPMTPKARSRRSGSSSPVRVRVRLLAVVLAKMRWVMASQTGVALAPWSRIVPR